MPLALLALQERRRLLLPVLHKNVTTEDWRGVGEAAIELAEIDAEIRGLEAKKD